MQHPSRASAQGQRTRRSPLAWLGLAGLASATVASLLVAHRAGADPLDGTVVAAPPRSLQAAPPGVLAAARAVQPTGRNACPDPAMILVEGEYCPEVRHDCKRWLEAGGRYAYFRCAEYTKATCLSKARVHLRFCIDRDEYVPPGEKLPMNYASWNDATRVCGSLGKRVCMESEYNFACEGEEMRPYPYGWKRDADACNADRVDIYTKRGGLLDLRAGPDDKPRCVSPFGVHHMAGNLEEWTTIDATAKIGHPRPAMKGAWWQPSRNACRANQTAHDNFYKGIETGFRCCADSADANLTANGRPAAR